MRALVPKVPFRTAIGDHNLLGAALEGESWDLWKILITGSLGEPLKHAERASWKLMTGRPDAPGVQVDELTAVVGRRGGKSRAAATLAAYIGALCDHRDVLASGERGVIPILSASTSQAARVFAHVVGIIEGSPLLRTMVEGKTADVIKLSTGIDIEVRPASFRTIRGVTAVAAIADEVAFWHVEGTANPDTEILNALRPALATTGGLLAMISSPHARRGELFKRFHRHWGPQGDPRIVVATGPSRRFNPTLSEAVVRRAYEDDEAAASAEFGGLFRSDLEQFVNRATVEACVDRGVFERGRISGVPYKAFIDPSGGGGGAHGDSLTMAIGHAEGDRIVIDLIREKKPPFSPADTIAEFCTVLRDYGITRVTGDRWGGEFPRELCRRQGVSYDIAEQTKSELYKDLLPSLNSGAIALLDQAVVVNQICALERRVSRTGREMIDHPQHGHQHDDAANAVAGVASLCLKRRRPAHVIVGTYGSVPDEAPRSTGRGSLFSGKDYLAAKSRW